MTYTKLPGTDITVSGLALGCWPFAGGAVWGEQNDDVSIATVHAALDAGITFFDTAEGYGNSERVLGRGLKGRRDEAVIATKVGGAHLSSDDLPKACENSLKNLQTDYIDLYQIHWPNHAIPIEETANALSRLRDQGKIRAIGVCNFARGDLGDLLAVGDIATNQLPYSLLWRVIEREIQPMCLENEIGIICYSPLMQGLLAGRYASADEVPDGLARTRLYSHDRPMARHSEPGCETEVFNALSEIRAVADEIGVTMAEMALAWARQQPGITSLLVGARTPDEVQWNLPAVALALSEDLLQRLAEITAGIKNKLGNNPDMWMSESRMR